MSVKSIIMSAAGAASDNTPGAYSFTTSNNNELSTLTLSNIVTITGIDTAAAVTFNGNSFSINGGAWVTSGNILNGQTLQLRALSPSGYSGSIVYSVQVGTVPGTWTVNTRALDQTPDAFGFTTQNNAELNTVTTSNTITITGMDAGQNISVTTSACTVSINGGAYVSSGTIQNGQTLTARLTSSSSYSSGVTGTVFVGTGSGTFTVNTRAQDTTPDAYGWTTQNNAELSTLTTSNSINITGIEGSVSVSTSNCTVSINGGAYVASGSITNGQSLVVRVTSSGSYSTGSTGTVFVGTGSGTFTVNTRAADITPNAFSFTDQSGVQPSTVITSNSITLAGMDAGQSASVSVSGAGSPQVSINGGAWVTTGTAVNGNTIQVRQTSNATFGSANSMTVTVGGTTSSPWLVTTRVADTPPDAFSFTDQSNVELSTVTTSNTITVTGLEPNFSHTVNASGGTVDAGTSVLSGTFAASKTVTSTAGGTIVVAARITSSGSVSTAVNNTITIGGVSDIFTVTTRAQDNTADAFSFTTTTGAQLSTVTTSSTITISGLEPNVSHTVTASGNGGTVDAGTSGLSGTFATSKTVTSNGSGQIQVAARLTSSSLTSTSLATTVTVNSITSGTYTVTTRAPDLTADAFSFTSQNSVELSTVITSNTITITGLEPNYVHSISVAGGNNNLISAGTSAISGTYTTSTTATASAGGTIVVAARQTSASGFNAGFTATVTVNSLTSGTFYVQTRSADTAPDAFQTVLNTASSGATYTAANPGVLTTSSNFTVTGLEPSTAVTITASNGGQIDGGPAGLSGTWANSKSVTTNGSGQLTVAVRITSSSSFSTGVSSTIGIGTGTATYTVTTRAADTVPDAWSFNFRSGVEPNSSGPSNQSDTITVTGLEPNTAVEVTSNGGAGGQFAAGTTTLGAFAASARYPVASGSGSIVVAAQAIASSSFGTNVSNVITVGTGTPVSYIVQTRVADVTPNAFSFSRADANNTDPNVTWSSDQITVTGLEPNHSVSITSTGGTFQAGTTAVSGTWVSSQSVTTTGTGTLVIMALLTSSASFATSNSCVVTIGTVQGSFILTTRPPDATPSMALFFIPRTNAAVGTNYDSNIVQVTGVEPNHSFTVTALSNPNGTSASVDVGTNAVSGSYTSSTGSTVTSTASGTFYIGVRGGSSILSATLATLSVTLASTSNPSYSFTMTYQITTA